MKEDLRTCPYCRKSPPHAQVWADFDGHKRACIKRQDEAQIKAKLRAVGSEADVKRFEDLFGSLWK